MAEFYKVRYMEEVQAEKLFSSSEAAEAFAHELETKGKRFLVEPADLKPMAKHDTLTIPQYYKINVEISDANHFRRTINFVRQNGLEKEFAKQMMNLLSLLTSTRGRKLEPTELTNNPTQQVGYELKEDGTQDPFRPIREEVPMCRIYPDGYQDPGFGWSGAGMVGGFIFHHHERVWSIHT